MHWILCVVNLIQATISMYDSYNTSHRSRAGKICKFLQQCAKAQNVHKNLQDRAGWDVTLFFHSSDSALPQQTDSHSCGLFTAAYADCLSAGNQPRGFLQEDFPEFRNMLRVLLLPWAKPTPKAPLVHLSTPPTVSKKRGKCFLESVFSIAMTPFGCSPLLALPFADSLCNLALVRRIY